MPDVQVAPISVERVITLARSQKGRREQPSGSNQTKYGKAFDLDGVLWCGIFVWWVFDRCGIDLREHAIQHPHSTNAFDAAAASKRGRREGWKAVARADIRRGDILFYDFGVVAQGDPPDDNDHVGIAAGAVTNGVVRVWEGNTHPDGGGRSDGVFRRTRSVALVRHAYRPPYGRWARAQAVAASSATAPAALT